MQKNLKGTQIRRSGSLAHAAEKNVHIGDGKQNKTNGRMFEPTWMGSLMASFLGSSLCCVFVSCPFQNVTDRYNRCWDHGSHDRARENDEHLGACCEAKPRVTP